MARVEPLPPTVAPAPAEVQLALPGGAEAFAAAGLETLPHGAGDMSAKELRFCISYLNCGSQRQAAREAGYSEDNASKLLRNTAIARFLGGAIKVVAQNGDQLVRRVWERSVSWHEELMMLRAKPHADKSKADHQRETQLALMLTRNDTVLAALLNRLGIKLTGEVNMNVAAGTGGGDFIVLPPDALAGFAAMRQEVAATNRLTAASGGRN